MTTIAEAMIEVRADTSRVGSDIAQGVDSRSTSGIGRKIGLGITAAAGAVIAGGAFLKGAFDEAEEAAQIGRVTAAIIKTTGGVANVTAGEISNLSQKLSEQAGVDDELIQKGANLLLTFKNVRNEVGAGSDIFDRATASALDLSAAGFGSVESASKMLGKALNDPVLGMTALSRAGVTFSQEQKDTVARLVETNDVLGAQKLIMKEVESQVGGAARASATAGEKLAVTWGNFKETLGEKLAPIVNRSLDGVRSVISDFAKGNWAKGFGRIWDGFMAGLRSVKNRSVQFIVGTLAPSIRKGVGNIRNQWRQGWANFWRDPDKALTVTEGNVRSHFRTIGQITGLGGARSVARFAAAFGRLPGWGAKIAAQTTGDIAASLARLPNLMTSIGARAVGGIVGWLRRLPGQAAGFMNQAASGITGAFAGIPGQMMGLGADIVFGLAAGIRNAASSAISAAVDVASDALQAAKNALGSKSPSKEFMKLGADSGEGLAIGLRGSRGRVAKAAGEMSRSALVGGAGGMGGGRGMRAGRGGAVALTITNWHDGTGYISGIAADEFEDAEAFAGSVGRMRK